MDRCIYKGLTKDGTETVLQIFIISIPVHVSLFPKLKRYRHFSIVGCCHNFVTPKIPEMCDPIMLF